MVGGGWRPGPRLPSSGPPSAPLGTPVCAPREPCLPSSGPTSALLRTPVCPPQDPQPPGSGSKGRQPADWAHHPRWVTIGWTLGAPRRLCESVSETRRGLRGTAVVARVHLNTAASPAPQNTHPPGRDVLLTPAAWMWASHPPRVCSALLLSFSPTSNMDRPS